MKVEVSQGTLTQITADALALFIFEDEELFGKSKEQLTGDIPSAKSALDSGDFKGKKGSTLVLYPGDSARSQRIILVGLGKKEKFSVEQIRKGAATASKRARALQAKSLALHIFGQTGIAAAETAQALAEGSILAGYKFDKYITKSDDAPKVELETIILWSEEKAGDDIEAALEFTNAVCEGVHLTRDLANAPNNEIYPETLAQRVQQAGKEAGFDVTVFGKDKISDLKMGGLLAVNQGSSHAPTFIIMEYKGGRKDEKPVVIVGKGVTFDTGGISIKPAPGMSDMKMDMHGAATTIGTLYAVAKAKLPLNVIGLVPATENFISGDAIVPGDIVTFMNGKTAEIDNTDAEGRLILADALTYADRYKPQAVVDLATLTGACVIALGNVTSGLMGNNDELKTRLKKAADRTSEYVCELPLHEEYEDLIKSDVADVKNSGGRGAGAITAGLFLQKFIGDYPWAHLDIAGTAIAAKETDYMPKGGTGVGVRLLTDMLKNWQSM